MAETVSQLSEIEDMLRRLSAAKRATALKCITDLFLEDPGRYRPEHINLFDTLFNELIIETEIEAVAALSRRLAPITNAPIKIIGRLALDDDISVAEPVLARSPCTEDSILTDIARTKSQTHLLAIACRPQIPEAIVDLLVERGDDVVVRYVANNRGARLSATGMLALLKRAKSDDALAELINKRDDIPPHLLGSLASKISKDPPAAPAQTKTIAAENAAGNLRV